MKKCKAICIYHENTIDNLSIQTKNSIINLTPAVNARKFDTFTRLYQCILKTLKANNYYCDSCDAAGQKWYDIAFIEYNDPSTIKQCGIAI